MNKILKYGLYSVMAAMSFVSVSCTDEYKYDPADPANADNAKAAIEAAKTNFVIEGEGPATFTFAFCVMLMTTRRLVYLQL